LGKLCTPWMNTKVFEANVGNEEKYCIVVFESMLYWYWQLKKCAVPVLLICVHMYLHTNSTTSNPFEVLFWIVEQVWLAELRQTRSSLEPPGPSILPTCPSWLPPWRIKGFAGSWFGTHPSRTDSSTAFKMTRRRASRRKGRSSLPWKHWCRKRFYFYRSILYLIRQY